MLIFLRDILIIIVRIERNLYVHFVNKTRFFYDTHESVPTQQRERMVVDPGM